MSTTPQRDHHDTVRSFEHAFAAKRTRESRDLAIRLKLVLKEFPHGPVTTLADELVSKLQDTLNVLDDAGKAPSLRMVESKSV